LYLKSVGLAALCLLRAAPALAQVAILQIRVIEGEGAVHQPASRSARPITVEITEETGKPVAGAAVSFHLPEERLRRPAGSGWWWRLPWPAVREPVSWPRAAVRRVPQRSQARQSRRY
jgi:hypothetical protein